MVYGFLLTAAMSAQAEFTLVDESASNLNESLTPIKPLPVWTIDVEDKFMSKTLERWSRQANWSLVWDVKDKDVEVPHAAEFQGTFEEVVAKVFDNLARGGIHLDVTFYNGNRILRITSPNATANR